VVHGRAEFLCLLLAFVAGRRDGIGANQPQLERLLRRLRTR